MRIYILFFIFLAPQFGCEKYLDIKPDKKLVELNSVAAIQAMLDNESIMNLSNPGTGEVSADNYYVTESGLAGVTSIAQRNMYTWESDITYNEFPNHWSRLYDVINIANIALENIALLQPTSIEKQSLNNAKGSALLFRAKSFLTVAGYWAKTYDQLSASTDIGIPLRLSSDYEVQSRRASVQQTYEQILQDLKEAADLLPIKSLHPLRPSRIAAYGLMARTYLNMGIYDSALNYADKYLTLSPTLLNYNTLTASATNPIPKYNVEVIMHSVIPTPTILNNTRARIDSLLYQSYTTNDLRKVIFFKSNGGGTFSFKGSYNQNTSLFNGLATDEIYLIKAECLARKNNYTEGLATLNLLLEKRWKNGTYVPMASNNAQSALNIILTERRKELLFRDLRWMDLKRLNKEAAFQKTIKRKLNGIEFVLTPSDNRYALPIPEAVIAFSGIAQNPR